MKKEKIIKENEEVNKFFKREAKIDNRFYGKDNKKIISNKYFKFKHYLNEDNIIIYTQNVIVIGGYYVLVVDKNKGVYLKDWQLKKVHNHNDINFFLVKLIKKYFHPFTLNLELENFILKNFIFNKEDTFDNLKEIAKEQDTEDMQVANEFIYESMK